ncbi:MAG: hypothetical protein JF589_17105, partial [Gemmatimonadetes bacterium]|nr:hypothetical protein [Gemmatimonadota bacterium]
SEQQQRRDERAEAELRAHVGELTPDAWKDIANEADKAIDALTARHGELERERLRTRELLNEAERPPTPRDAKAVAPPARQPVAASAPRAAEGAAAAAPEPARPLAEQPPVEMPAAVIAAEAQLMEQANAGADADVTPRPMPRADAGRGAGAKQNTFDELAFLSSVVDTPAGAVDLSPTDSSRAGDGGIVNMANDPGTLLQGGAARSAGSPLSMNVSGNNPIIIKDKVTETAKTLKCAECGAMNYPTEWYCERCGAELASL